jgi:hypothetical protein
MEGDTMTAQGSAKAVDKTTPQPPTTSEPSADPGVFQWLRGWRQVLIAELLHVLDRRRGPSKF